MTGRNGSFRARPPVMRDVARLAGVSHQTVSRVLNGHPQVSPAARQRVREAVEQLGYKPNVTARALASRRTMNIGVIAAGPFQYGPTTMLLSIAEIARRRATRPACSARRPSIDQACRPPSTCS